MSSSTRKPASTPRALEATTRRKSLRGVVARFFIAVLSLLSTTAVVEIVLETLDHPKRTFDFLGGESSRPSFIEDRELFWRLDSDADFYIANRLGLRGRLPGPQKQASDLRIACVGDSSTFGIGVRYEDTYCVRLERMRQHAHPHERVESILAALPGYSSHQDRILYERYVAPLEPDVTILYTGAWNDFVPAVRYADAQRSGMLGRLDGLRTLRLVRGAIRSERERSDYLEAFEAGRAPDGRRVSEREYEQNLFALIDTAQAVGSTVLIIVPPLPRQTIERFPIALRYREITRRVASRHEVATIDGPALFDPSEPGPALFLDFCHPTALGHERLSGTLFDRLESLVPQRPRPPATRMMPTIERLQPAAVPAFRPQSISLHGTDLEDLLHDPQLWVGNTWIRHPRANGPRLLLELTGELLPGRHFVEASTAQGLLRSRSTLTVERPQLRTHWRSEGGHPVIHVSGRSPRGWHVRVWRARSARSTPADTPYGPFLLATGSPGPVELQDLDLPHADATVAAGGSWHVQMEAHHREPAFLQAAIVDLTDLRRGTLTGIRKIEPHD